MTTTAGHSFYIGPIGSFYNQVNDTGSWEPLVIMSWWVFEMPCSKVVYWVNGVFNNILKYQIQGLQTKRLQ